MKCIRRLALSFTLVFSLQSESKLADWTIVVYIQAKNDLSKFAIRNLKDMAKVGSNDNLNILVQLSQPVQKGLWRYKVGKKKIELIEHISGDMDGSKVDEIVGAAEWGFKGYPSKYTGFVEWGHGCGALDPENWWAYQAPHQGNKIKMPEVIDRGILFNYEKRTYLNNEQQLEALTQIKNKVLGGKNIDLLGMDSCLMASIEVGYQVKNCANLLVTSQEVASALGWSYASVFDIASNRDTTPFALAQGIVRTYDEFYKDKLSWYTQSAIDLNKIDILKASIDQVVYDLNAYKEKFGFTWMKNIVLTARNMSLKFRLPCFIDIYSFYSELYQLLSGYHSVRGASTIEDNMPRIDEDHIVIGSWNYDDVKGFIKPANFNHSKDSSSIDIRSKPIKTGLIMKSSSVKNNVPEVEKLKQDLLLGMKVLESTVIANASGKDASRAKGLSIYFPQYRLDPSYVNTEFAKDSAWILMLSEILGD